jgi:hypothetical protein
MKPEVFLYFTVWVKAAGTFKRCRTVLSTEPFENMRPATLNLWFQQNMQISYWLCFDVTILWDVFTTNMINMDGFNICVNTR